MYYSGRFKALTVCSSAEHQAQSLFSMAASQTGGYLPLNHRTLPPLEHHQNITSSFAPFSFFEGFISCATISF